MTSNTNLKDIGSDYQEKFKKVSVKLRPVVENYINFQKCLLTDKHGDGHSDRQFTYILDLSDEIIGKLATM